MTEFIGPEIYDLCPACMATLVTITRMFKDGDMPDTDDNEAPIMHMYDAKLHCGGNQCTSREDENNARSGPTEGFTVQKFIELGVIIVPTEDLQSVLDLLEGYGLGAEIFDNTPDEKSVTLKSTQHYPETKVINCVCGEEELRLDDPWATECANCGREYNGAGQLLVDRRYWGEETGETFS